MTPPFTLATFNVKDLFDATPNLADKLATLAPILERANADVVALQEVGSCDVVRALAARVPALAYRDPVVGTADARGIRCAILSRFPVRASKVHTADSLAFPAFFQGDPAPFGARIPLRRGVPYARVEVPALGPVDVLVAHFKSNRPLPLRDASGKEIAPVTSRELSEAHLRSLVWRSAEALFVRGLVDALLAEDPARHVAVAGDLNDHGGSHVVRILEGGGPLALVPCADAVPEAARFSILRHGAPQQIDHILVTRALRERLSAARFLNEELTDHGDFADEVLRADSDHAAFVVSFS